MQFEKSAYTVKERDSVLHIPIVRTGDLSFKSSVRCFTRTMSAMVMDDFEERRNADESRITFLKGEKVDYFPKYLLEVCMFVSLLSVTYPVKSTVGVFFPGEELHDPHQ